VIFGGVGTGMCDPGVHHPVGLHRGQWSVGRQILGKKVRPTTSDGVLVVLVFPLTILVLTPSPHCRRLRDVEHHQSARTGCRRSYAFVGTVTTSRRSAELNANTRWYSLRSDSRC
jgi:hypothetical protein